MSNEDESELHPAPSTIPPEQRKNKLILSAVIILVGVIMVVITAILYAPFTAPAVMIKVGSSQLIGAVVDSGDSGTTLIVYGCNADPCDTEPSSCSSTCKSVDKLKTVECESRGLHNYTVPEEPQLRNDIGQCLKEGSKGYNDDLVPVSYIIPAGKREIFENIKSNFTNFRYLEENGKDIKPVDVIQTTMNAELYRPITDEVKFRPMTPAVPLLVILVIGVFVIVAGISYLHMVCDRSKQLDA